MADVYDIESATHIEAETEPRYWEDASVNGVVDEDGSGIPGRSGDVWRVRIEIASGVVEGWPQGTSAQIHYKICDAGDYWLTNGTLRIAKWRNAYVPTYFLSHGGSRNSDYIIMKIGADGAIEDYQQPIIAPNQWEPLPHT